MRYFIWDNEVGVVKAAQLCGSVEKFKALREKTHRGAAQEYALYIRRKILTFVR